MENIAPLSYTYTLAIDIVYLCARIWTLSNGGYMITIKDEQNIKEIIPCLRFACDIGTLI